MLELAEEDWEMQRWEVQILVSKRIRLMKV